MQVFEVFFKVEVVDVLMLVDFYEFACKIAQVLQIAALVDLIVDHGALHKYVAQLEDDHAHFF